MQVTLSAKLKTMDSFVRENAKEKDFPLKNIFFLIQNEIDLRKLCAISGPYLPETFSNIIFPVRIKAKCLVLYEQRGLAKITITAFFRVKDEEEDFYSFIYQPSMDPLTFREARLGISSAPAKYIILMADTKENDELEDFGLPSFKNSSWITNESPAIIEFNIESKKIKRKSFKEILLLLFKNFFK